MTYNDVTRNEKAISGALALATHLLFLALLVFGVTWHQKKPDSAVIVELWNNLPPLPQPMVEDAPPEVKPAREPPKPIPKVEPKPLPKPEAKSAPKPTPKPDIALKEKLEKERKLKEQQILEAKKRDDEKKKQAALKEQQAKEVKAKQEQEEALKKQAAQQQAAQTKRLEEYTRRISDRIKRFIVEPPNMQGNPEVQYEVVQIPGGEVLSVRLKRSSGVAVYDSAVERAILKAQPLPPPPEGVTFNEVRELNLKIRPKE